MSGSLTDLLVYHRIDFDLVQCPNLHRLLLMSVGNVESVRPLYFVNTSS